MVANEQLHEQVASLASTWKDKAFSYLDNHLLEYYPGRNLTSKILYDEMVDSYTFLVGKLITQHANETILASITPTTASFITPTVLASTKNDSSVRKGIFTGLPLTVNLIRSISSGNLSSIIDMAVPVTFELKNATTNLFSYFFSPIIPHEPAQIGFLDYPSLFSKFSAVFGLTAKITVESFVQGLLWLFGFLTNAFDAVFRVVLFAVTLHTLTLDDDGILHYVGAMLNVLDPREILRSKIEHAVNSALILNLKLTLFHILFGWLSFSIAGCEVRFTYFYLCGTDIAARLYPGIHHGLRFYRTYHQSILCISTRCY